MSVPAKKCKRGTAYSDRYHDTYPCIIKCSPSVKDHAYKFHCTICNVNLSCHHGGMNDIKKHVHSDLHKQNEKTIGRNSPLDKFVKKKTEVHPSINAEAKLAMLIVQHNTFFSISDHMSAFIREEFKTSSVGAAFTCGKTKTRAIVNCIGDFYFDNLVSDMKEMPFSIMLDASNDEGLEKMFPMTVKIFDINYSRIMTKFFDMNMLSGTNASSAHSMFESVANLFTKYDISWEFCIGIGLDNTNVNIGERNSIKTRVREKNNNIFISGCPCHILHNATQKSSCEFNKCTSFDIEDHCVDLYFWFDKSGKRKNKLNEYYQFCDLDYANVIKFISTRWLSLEMCVNRELKKYEGLKSYFLSENFSDKRFKRLSECYLDPMTEIYLLFYQSALAAFTKFNKYLQKEEPLILKLYDAQNRFMDILASKFIKPFVIQEHKKNHSISKIDTCLQNQRDDSSLGIGPSTRKKIRELLDTGDIMETQVDKFFDGVRKFYEKAFAYCAKWLPLDDVFLQKCVFVDFNKRADISFGYIEECITRLTKIFSMCEENPSLLIELEEQFLVFQSLGNSDIPQYVWDSAKVLGEKPDESSYRMDIIWGYLKQQLPLLAEVALSVLVIPHSNAGEERVFSMVRKNLNEFRSRLEPAGSLNAIMRIKLSVPESLTPCHKWEPSADLLSKCKAATMLYNEEHCDKSKK